MSKDKKVVDFLKGSAVLVLANIVLKSINFILLPLYTKYLSPKELGISDTITTFSALLFPLLVMGLDSAFSAFYFDEESDEHHSLVLNTVWFTLAANSIIPLLLCAFAGMISNVLFSSSQYWIIVILSMVSVTANLLFIPFALEMRMKNRMVTFAIINLSASTIMIISNIVFVTKLKWGATSLIASTLIAQCLQLILYLCISKSKIKFEFFNLDLWKKMIKFAIPMIPTVIAVWALSMSDRYMLLYFLDESQVGIYGIAARFSSVVAVISNAVYIAYTSFAFDKKNDVNAREQYRRILSAFFFIIFGMCFTFSFFGKEILSFMTDSRYHYAYKIMPGVLFGQISYGVYTIVSYGIAFTKKTKYSFLATASGAIANILLNVIFVPIFGIQATANINFIGYSVMCLVGYLFSSKLFPCDYKIERIIFSMILGYSIIFLGLELSIFVKIGIWIIVFGTGCIIFKDVVNDFTITFKMIIDNTIRKERQR